jgi:eukaryotic-like serine/threonine-protein kinase
MRGMASTAHGLLSERYEIGELRGEGATATVSRAFDRLLHRDVAIKLLKPAFAQDASVVERFYAEARAAAGIVDPHVVGLYDVVADGPLHALVMEYVDGPSLADMLKREGKLPEERAVAYARQIAQALAAAHARGILHRDVKPANVLLAPGDVVKVTDFGLAKAFERDDLALTEAGRLVGSAYYFSPEQAQGLPLTPASDLYSLGVVLYQLVSGSLPFDASSPVAAAVAHVTTPAPSEGALVRAMSPGLAAIVGKLLQKDPHERFASAADLAAALDAIDTAHPNDPAWDAPTLLGEIPAVERPAARTGTARAAAVVAAALASFFAWSKFHSQRTVEPALSALGKHIAGRAQHVPVSTAAIAGAVLIFLIALVALATSSRTVALADVRREPVTQARAALASLGLTPAVTARADETAPAGTVIAQSPSPGAALHRGDVVRLTVSSGAPLVTLPNLVGTTLAGAHDAMARLALHGRYAARISDAEANTVIEQFPAPGTRLRHGAEALIVISTGPQPHIDLTSDGPMYAPPGWRKHHRDRGRQDGGGGDGGD